MYGMLMYSLRMVKMFHDIGIYDKAAGNIKEIDEDDYYELVLNGLANVAQYYEAEELGEEHCCGGHVVHHFSGPVIPEYYRLCRLYEFKHSIAPEENPYVQRADDYYCWCLNNTHGDFASNFDNEGHPREIWAETCPEHNTCEYELIELVHDVLEFYRAEVQTLRAELRSGPTVWLPALPPHVEEPKQAKKTRSKKII
jgi:hypothetical protein